MTPEQVERIATRIAPDAPAIVSVFAGRVADTGRDPVPLMRACLEILQARRTSSCCGRARASCSTSSRPTRSAATSSPSTNDVLAKLALVGKDLDEYSLETVQMFYRDATAAGYSIAEQPVAA